MNKKVKAILVSLLFILLLPCIASASQFDFSNKLVFFEDKLITQNNMGNITIVIGDADIKTSINGSVIVIFGKAAINGMVGGDIVSVFGDVYIKDKSLVQGNVVSLGKLRYDNDVIINGTKVNIDVDIISLFKSNGIIINGLIVLSVITLIAGLILISIFPGRYRVMSYKMSKGIPRRMAMGGLVVVGFTIVVIFLLFSIIAPIFYLLFLMFADIVGSIFVGTLIFKENYERTTIYIQFLVGQLLVSILKIVPLILIPNGSYTAMLIYGICLILLQYSMAFLGIGTIIDTGFGKKTSSYK
ncbi:LOW QUALITY PROTEIN: hypothetical protein Cpap_1318 [Ruminiclostridium papyrosolvens DSM 2782]|uniref:Polymer-forming cytoskeletal protein n=2 Tax=Ruminiclostridium papyrosolvens TaxID=29362 RepID=F1TFP6_9FIRM|nr:hypothetical protein [Ruminiclostridium papyrosolvens]EGD46778.1 LOW QUALITY PROTEIN: hypothetical protein Cpap_1318 [Ruminiclostridium papyrosolvens DSM 2782]WES34882.1 hypothetical protein P0092_02565 [Ruminiclostridium papyrosolvens DSM 2782]